MISIRNISKSFLIPHEQKRSVKGSLFSMFRKKTYERIEVLKDVSLEIQRGEFVGVMGSNGSGKSTLLRILAGVYQPDTGEVKTSGKVSAILELGVGFHPELTARENVLLHGSLLGISSAYLRKHLFQIFSFAELQSFMDTPLKHFSSGMMARLAFAIAIQVDADAYLMDEVLAVGDEAFQEKCFEVFRNFKTSGKTLVFVSHSRPLLEKICDRIV